MPSGFPGPCMRNHSPALSFQSYLPFPGPSSHTLRPPLTQLSIIGGGTVPHRQDTESHRAEPSDSSTPRPAATTGPFLSAGFLALEWRGAASCTPELGASLYLGSPVCSDPSSVESVHVTQLSIGKVTSDLILLVPVIPQGLSLVSKSRVRSPLRHVSVFFRGSHGAHRSVCRRADTRRRPSVSFSPRQVPCAQ